MFKSRRKDVGGRKRIAVILRYRRSGNFTGKIFLPVRWRKLNVRNFFTSEQLVYACMCACVSTVLK